MFKVNWEADPDQIRYATPLPSLLARRDYLVIALIFALVLLGAAITH